MDLDCGRLSVDETAITLPFADGDYTFFLPMVRAVAAEREADCSLNELFLWLAENIKRYDGAFILSGPSPATWKHCHAVIRNALIGGGANEQPARELVATYCYPARAAIYDMALAFEILEAAIYGIRSGSKKNKANKRSPAASTKAQ